jgi:hypothetical protein
MEMRYGLGLRVIDELSRRSKEITLVSASDYLSYIPGMDNVVDNAKNISLLVPIPFFKDSKYKLFDPIMPNFDKRIEILRSLDEISFKEVLPIINIDPYFLEETREVLRALEDYSFLFTGNDYDISQNNTIYFDSKKREMWNFMKGKEPKDIIERDLF